MCAVEVSVSARGAGNGRQAGGGQALCPDALCDGGLLDVTVVPELSGEVGGTLATLLKEGREAALDQAAVRARLPWLEIEAEAPLVLNLDGEPVESSRFRIECVPGRLRMHLPDDCPLLGRSEEHTSELQSLMRISYAGFCLKKKKRSSLLH